MSDPRGDPHPDGLPEDDDRSDIERVVEDVDDPVPTGPDGPVTHDAPDALTDPGMPDGVGGTGGVTKNQDDDAQ